ESSCREAARVECGGVPELSYSRPTGVPVRACPARPPDRVGCVGSGRVAMRIRLRDRRAWLVLAAGVAVAGVIVVAATRWWPREEPVPEIPRPDLSAFTERQVQMDVFTAGHQVELQPRSATAWGEYGIVLRA